MRDRKRITDKLLLHGYEQQYKRIQLLQGRIFTKYDASNYSIIEKKILENIKLASVTTSYNTSAQGDLYSEPLMNSGHVKTNKPIASESLQSFHSELAGENYNFSLPESLYPVSNEDRYSSNQNHGGFSECRVDKELEEYATRFSAMMKKVKIESPESSTLLDAAVIFFLALTICVIRIWYEHSQSDLPQILMIILNLVAYFYTIVTIGTDIYQRFEKWVCKCKIEERYKNIIVSDCKHKLFRWILLIAVITVSLFYFLYKRNSVEMFIDLMTVSALTISLTGSWISDRFISYMEKCTKSNRSFLLFDCIKRSVK